MLLQVYMITCGYRSKNHAALSMLKWPKDYSNGHRFVGVVETACVVIEK